jgi:hypothetical protein
MALSQTASEWKLIVKVIGNANATLTRISRSGRLKLPAASLHQHQGISVRCVLSDGAHVSRTTALAVVKYNVALCPSLAFCRLSSTLIDSLAWVLRSFDTSF